MATLFGGDVTAFVILTLILVGGCAVLMGQALARTWRPLWHILPYGLLLALSDRFLIYALAEGELLHLTGFLIEALVMVGYALLAFRLTRVGQMVRQYPWLYERAGLLTWRARNPED